MEQPSSKALFTPAKTQRASEAIYNQIYPKIISGELRPGDRLPPERELADRKSTRLNSSHKVQSRMPSSA